jgi:hypothetical protein
MAVASGETGSMPRALDDLSLKLAFGQRAAEVRPAARTSYADPAEV